MFPAMRGPQALLGKAVLLSLLSATTPTSAFNLLPNDLNQVQNLLDLSPSPPFDIREATISSIHNALVTGLTTCHSLISSYLARIEAFNPSLHAILSLNPHALDLASAIDSQLASGNSSVNQPLLCIPILLKDNFNTFDLPTTAGSLSLSRNYPKNDAPTVTALKRAGAVILGKTNMHEFALEGISVSSLAGQTINPYDSTRTPGGSSGGTGAAIAANLAVLGTGTDTVNSLRSPASANCLVSWRGTRGLVDKGGVVPVGWTQDAVGGMARGVDDLAVMMTVMASTTNEEFDGEEDGGDHDNTTALVPPEMRGKDYSQALYSGLGKLEVLRLGVLNGFFNHTAGEETTPVNQVMEQVLRRLEAAGAQLVNITDPVYDAVAIAARLDVQTFEFREGLDAYLARTTYTRNGTEPRSFNDVFTLGKKQFLVLPSQYSYIRSAFNRSTSSPEYFVRQHGISQLKTTLAQTFSTHKLDAIIYPEQKNLVVKIGSPSQSGRNGILAALTESPVITVPVGFSDPKPEEAPLGVPIGMEILGRPWTDDLLLGIAKHVSEVLGPVRRMPVGGGGLGELHKVVEVRGGGYESVPVVTNDNGNIPGVYPLGVY
ncbi:amidase signature domain-containing protein [Pseudoneurospora amorphoporcata]|uniref:Amidase signature domain-containing protein n=1 Tax=Pseudoneurospora amorphoporcata TaxID=241081 RepID=A0AAN6NU66_9PEZI|nr:amidase signature domain-containing protein [Pseudoneurospora amorphoporcata]